MNEGSHYGFSFFRESVKEAWEINQKWPILGGVEESKSKRNEQSVTICVQKHVKLVSLPVIETGNLLVISHKQK